MTTRWPSLLLALLTLLGAWHEGVHLLEHRLQGHHACATVEHGHGPGHEYAHDHDHAHDHAPVGSDGGPLVADPHHEGESHHCFVCSAPNVIWGLESVPALAPARPSAGFGVAALAGSSWVLGALPPGRGPPLG